MFHVIAQARTLLVRNTKQRQKENAVAYSKPPTLETYSGSVLYFIGYNAAYLRHKGACPDSQPDPRMRPCMLAIRFGANRAKWHLTSEKS